MLDLSDEELRSRLSRTNDLVVIRHIRSATGLGIRESKEIAETLRALAFDTVAFRKSQIGQSLTASTMTQIYSALSESHREIEDRNPFGFS